MIKDQSYGIVPLKKDNGVWMVCLIRHIGGHWAFPKGHPEEGETPKEAAERELEEESGLKLKRFLSDEALTERYRFRARGQLIDKGVTYFIGEVEGDVQLQVEEVVDYKWVPIVSASGHLSFNEARRICRVTYDILMGL